MQGGEFPTSIPAMNATQKLLAEIETYCVTAGIAVSTLGRKAVNDGKLVDRIRSGGSVTLDTAERLRRFMHEHPASVKGKQNLSDDREVA